MTGHATYSPTTAPDDRQGLPRRYPLKNGKGNIAKIVAELLSCFELIKAVCMCDDEQDYICRRNRADFVQRKTSVDFEFKVLYNRRSMSEIKQEKTDITIAKGLGILLVVIGHILSHTKLEGNDWFIELTNLIYSFHMPFFMVISGYVFFRPGRVEKLYETYPSHVKKQTLRLLLPFFAMGIFVLIGKMLAAPYLHVDNKPDGITTGLYNLFWNTKESPSFFIWYVFVLYIYAITTPVLFRFIPQPLYVCLGIGAILYLIDPPEVLYLSKLVPYLLFFMIGGLLRAKDETYLKYVDQYKHLWLALFLASLSLLYVAPFDYKFVQLICGLLSVPALHALCRLMVENKTKVTDGFYYLGQNTLVIYLFNTICIGLTKAIMFKVIYWNDANFFIFLPILIAGGIIGPLIIKFIWDQRKLVLSRLPS